MTSAAPPPTPHQAASQQHQQHQHQQQQQQQHQHQHQQQQKANAPYPPTTPVTPQAQAAVSPPSKRDLKSWWKGFKLPSKHQESHGTAVPSTLPRTRTKLRKRATVFAEDMNGSFSHIPPALAPLRNIMSDEEKLAAHQASASMSLPLPAAPPGTPKLSAVARIMTWRFGASPRALRPKSHKSRPKLTVAEPRPQGIFGVPLRQSITYANVAISLVDEDGKSYIYGYVPIVVAKCGVFLKERGA